MEYPVAFTDREYNSRLGIYQKWMHGDKNKKIKKLYSMSAFQAYTETTGYAVQPVYHKYAEYLELSVDAIINNSSDWYVRIYMDESLLHPNNPDKNKWIEKLNLLQLQDRVQIICVKFPRYYSNGTHQGLLSVMFRYLTLFDPNVSISLFRDIDNIWTQQHQYFIDAWITKGTDICLYMNENYKRQQAIGLTHDDVILEDKFYSTLLSGLWNIKNPTNGAYPISIWQKIFAYIESYTGFVTDPKYIGYKYYGSRFAYGFDELALTRVVLPIFIQMGMTFYTIPIKIYDVDYLLNLFNNPVLSKFLKKISDADTLETVKTIIINNYWSMDTENAGLSQYMLCIITNIYFGIITNKSKFYSNNTFNNSLKNQIIPNPLLMAIGLFTFKNYQRYNWYPINGKSTCGADIVNNFLTTNKKITLEEWTANSDLSNSGNGTPVVLPPSNPPSNPPYAI
jgi:hypothetical protein